MRKKIPIIDDIDLFVFDFDGVLTDNLVHIDQNGIESVTCSRADGLAFDVLRKIKKPSYILSTEKNSIVSARAKKLGIPVLQGVRNKEKSLKELVSREGCKLSNLLYVGNDINDFCAMEISGFSVCPLDSHPKIKKISDLVLTTNGGRGVIRELLEEVFGLDFIEILYKY